MEDGIANDGTDELDELHSQLADEVTGTESTAENPVVEKVDDSAGVATTGVSPNKDFCEEMLATCLRWHSESIHGEFLRKLEPIADPAQARRIADRAAMSPEMQQAIAAMGARAASKYGVAGYISNEMVLVTALLLYFKNLNAARQDCDELLKKHSSPPQPATQPQEEKETA